MKRTMKIGKGRTATFDDENAKVYESLEDWKADGERRFGPDVKKWRFKCPMCGHVAAVQDFVDAGAKDPANSAYEECLGRYTGKGSPKEGDSSGCNYGAYKRGRKSRKSERYPGHVQSGAPDNRRGSNRV